MVKVVVHQDQGGKDRFPAARRVLLIWFESGRKGLGSCNRGKLSQKNFEIYSLGNVISCILRAIFDTKQCLKMKVF